MSPIPPTAQIHLATSPDFTLGAARVRPSLRQVECGRETFTLEPRVMQVLVLLAAAAGRTVSRDEMLARCWGGTIVGEDAIQRCIGRLRKLAESTGAFEIVTLSRVGYRLGAGASGERDARPERLLAVLPFDSIPLEPGFDYFADGVSEEILQSIARRSGIRVIGRTSSFQFRGPEKIVARIAQELGATHILDGSVRRSGGRLRVAAHLMDVSDLTLLWSDRFEGDLDDPFELQDEVARGVIRALDGVLRAPSPASPRSGAAFDTLAKLQQLAHRSSFGGENAELIAEVERIAPDSAGLWGLLASVRASQRWVEPARESELREAARVAATNALQLDPNCGAAHKALFMIEPPAGRFLAREQRLGRAHASNPEDGELLWSLYMHYLSVGRLQRSAERAEEAYRVDPLRPLNVIAYANSLYTAGLAKQSLALMQHAVDRWPTDATVFAIAVWTAAAEGEHEFAESLLRSDWRARLGPQVRAPAEMAARIAQGIIHDPERLREALRAGLDGTVRRGEIDIPSVGLLAYLGMDLDSLYEFVARMPIETLREPHALLSPLNGLSHLFLRVNARLRTHPRFVHLCRRLGLVDYWQASGQWPDCVDAVAEYYDFRAEAIQTR